MIMNTINDKSHNVIPLHLLFWVLSFNFFNSFFNRGIESGYVMDGLELTWLNVLLISNVILVFFLIPFIWYIKGIKKWVKYSISGIGLTLIGWGVFLMFYPGEDNIVAPVILSFFLNNFLYVFIFHITIICVVYMHLNVMINKYLSQGRFFIYLFSTLVLVIIGGIINYAIFDLCIDLMFPSLFYISWFKIWELILIMFGYIGVTIIAFLLKQYSLVVMANQKKDSNELLSDEIR